MTIPIRELESNVTESMKIEGARVLRTVYMRPIDMRREEEEQFAAKLYAHMEYVRRRNEEISKRRRNYGYAD